MEEIRKTLNGHAGMYADNPLVISAMEFILSQALQKRDLEWKEKTQKIIRPLQKLYWDTHISLEKLDQQL